MNWPALALIDPDVARRTRMSSLFVAMGIDCRVLPEIPDVPDDSLRDVRLVVCAREPDRTLIDKLRATFIRAAIIIGSADRSQQVAVRAFRAGADDFACLGASDAELTELITARLRATPPIRMQEAGAIGGLVGDSDVMRDLRTFIHRLSGSEVTVLISGETGTGKERAAMAIQRLSPRARGPLVALNCAAIPEALLEGELFGYERGAFSGAVGAYPGKLKLADGGTLLLDEVGELSLAGQAKVLRALETREVYRLGSRVPTRFDVRVIAATNRDLEAEMRAGRFRVDLFYRLAVARVYLPPLRERRCDIAVIADALLDEIRRPGGTPRPFIESAAIARLGRHDWPGNARELRNALEIALVRGDGTIIRASDLPPEIGADPLAASVGPTPEQSQVVDPQSIERARLQAALAEARGNKTLAAHALHCSRMTLYRRLVRAGLLEAPDPGDLPVTVSRRARQSLSQ